MAESLDEIVTALRRITEEGGDGNFVIFFADARKNYYIQFVGAPGDRTLRAEAVGNKFLKSPFVLSEWQMAQLRSIGWSPPSGDEGNFCRQWNVKDDTDRRRIAQEVMRALVEVYGLPANQAPRVELNLE